jgi:D-xylose transport system ATP-binding protein
MTPPGDVVLEVAGVSKHFGHVTALDDVWLSLKAGEVTAVVGDNGAGKSTLCNILTGVLQPDEGTLMLRGEPVKLTSPARAQHLGIATVFQDLALVPQRDVVANVFAGRELCRGRFFLDRRRMLKETNRLISDMRVGLPSASTRVDQLSGGQRQAAAIVRAMLGSNAVTLLDEPTAALGVRESGQVMELVGRLREAGQAVMLISHNMESVFDHSDRVIVMRLGRVRADRRVSEVSRDEIVGLITGRLSEAPVMTGADR